MTMLAAGADGCRAGWIHVARELGSREIASSCCESARTLFSQRPRPDVIAPNIEGLYFVGDSVEGDGVGGDIATGTGMKCADIILSGK